MIIPEYSYIICVLSIQLAFFNFKIIFINNLPPSRKDDSSTDESRLYCTGWADGATRALAGAGRLLDVDEAADE